MKRGILSAVFIMSIVLANVVTGKIIDVGIGGLLISGGVVFYSLTFLMTDMVTELYGETESRRLVVAGFVASVLAAILLYITQILPVAEFARPRQEAYEVLLGQNIRFVAASMVAYLSSQFLDVRLFSFIGWKTRGRHKWLRNNGSTIVSQFVDTLVFTTLAFAGAVPVAAFFPLVFGRYFAKLLIAALDTPVFYLLTYRQQSVDFGRRRS